jgi:SAM-dependent methyltransferase
LAAIKKDLGDQARRLLPADFEIDGDILEFGSPGRYAKGLAEHYRQTGQIIAVDDAPTASFMHYIDAGTTHPYDKYMHLDYSNMDLSSIGDKSVKVMTCYVGLHHFSEEALDQFLTEVKRILKDDGHFLLVDHDIDNEQTLAMAHMAHMVFNAVNGVSLQDELTEIRNFQPLTYWQQKLCEKGIPCEIPNKEIIRQGDPTRNLMMMGKNTPFQFENRSVFSPIIADAEEKNQSDEARQTVFARSPVLDSSVATSGFTLFANSNPTQNNDNQAAPEGDSTPAPGL